MTTGSTTRPASPPPGDGGPGRIRIDLGYDGSAFHGWAAQPGLRTVQGVLEVALATLARVPVPTTCAGRTDAGVHARGQVVHCDPPGPVDPAEWESRLRGLLPPDVTVQRVVPAPAGFDARFAAIWRRYSYRIADGSPTDPLRHHDTWQVRRPLDLALMNTATAPLLGEHDFAAFCRRREGASTVRGLLEYRWHRDDAGIVVATVRADAFCHSMVRALVGALLPVGEHRRGVEWPAGVLRQGVRDPAVTVAPAHGLCLEQVGYPDEAGLAARAEAARAYRGRTPQA